jgi:hypothetical protein
MEYDEQVVAALHEGIDTLHPAVLKSICHMDETTRGKYTERELFMLMLGWSLMEMGLSLVPDNARIGITEKLFRKVLEMDPDVGGQGVVDHS